MSESPEAISQRPSPVKIWLLAARPRTLPAGVALQRNLADALGMHPWELRTNGE